MKSEVYNIDCLEYMRGLPDKHFDLVIADPPYGINAAQMTMGKGKKAWTKKQWDSQKPNETFFDELMRVSKNQIIFGGNYFQNLPSTRSWIIWDKGINGVLSFADGEMAWTSFDSVMRIAKIDYRGTIGTDEKRIHPTQKPVALYAWILDNYGGGGAN